MIERKTCIEHRKDTAQCIDDIHALKKDVNGNGNKGLKERMTIIETNFAAVGTSIKVTGAILGVIQFLTGAAVAAISMLRPH